MQVASNGKMILKQLCDLYLQYQHSRVLAGALTPKHYNDHIGSLGTLMSFLGQSCRIESIRSPYCVRHIVRASVPHLVLTMF